MIMINILSFSILAFFLYGISHIYFLFNPLRSTDSFVDFWSLQKSVSFNSKFTTYFIYILFFLQLILTFSLFPGTDNWRRHR